MQNLLRRSFSILVVLSACLILTMMSGWRAQGAPAVGSWQLADGGWRMAATSHAPPATSHAPPATSHAPPATSQQLRGPSERDDSWRRWDALPPPMKAKVDPRIIAELRGDLFPAHVSNALREAALGVLTPQPRDKTRFLVYLREQVDLAAIDQQVFASEVERRTAFVTALMAATQQAQAGVRAALDAQMAANAVSEYQPFYIVNAVAVEGDLATVVNMALRSDVERLVANYPLLSSWQMADGGWQMAGGRWQMADSQPPTANRQPETARLDPANWNIELVGADRVWSELGVRGEGAVVAGFDTGVNWQHPALLASYRGNLGNGQANHNYNWFEPDSKLYPDGNLGQSVSNQPYDCSGHGTHTMGTMVGAGDWPGTQIGMAPGARWIALPGICFNTMPGGIRDDIGALKAFQWLLCPTDLSGNLATADCSKAPDVVNNSWGSANPVNDVLRPAVQRLRSAGIAPVFAAGNPGAGAGSIGAPANAPEAIAVGATDSSDSVAYFSGRGPSFYEGEQKPELSAPGVDVLSSVFAAEYLQASGTSMAAPHVAGLVALIVSADLRDGRRDFNVDEIERFMTLSALDLGRPGADDDYGYGRLRALEATRWAISSGDLRGTVHSATNEAPVGGARMTGVDGAPSGAPSGPGNQFVATTNASGIYSTSVPGGVYRVTIDAWGYQQAVFDGQQVFAGSSSVADFRLEPLPTALLSGIVRSGAPSRPGPIGNALVYVKEQPAVQTHTDSNGSYALALPLGVHTVVAEAAGYRAVHSPVQMTGAGMAVDFDLQPAPSILLVEADAYGGWFFSWPVANIFRRALDQEHYQYDFWRIQYTNITDTETLADGSLGYGIPSTDTLKAYDLVIWWHNGCSYWVACSLYEHTDKNLPGYLANGGRLILSGQDYARLDGGQFFDGYLHADAYEDSAAGVGAMLAGADFLQGIQVSLTNASLYGYNNGTISFSPDAVTPGYGDGAAYPVLTYHEGGASGGLPAALAIDPCDAPYRAIYMAMGYENIGPRAGAGGSPGARAITEVLDRSITWVTQPKQLRDMALIAMTTAEISAPGGQASYEVQLTNGGPVEATFLMSLSGNQWPARLMVDRNEVTGPLTLGPCAAVNLTVNVDVPAGAQNRQSDRVTLTAAYSDNSAPGASRARTVVLATTAFAPWESEPPMPSEPGASRARLGAVALPNDIYLYAIGGWAYSPWSFFPTATNINQRYNACTQRWEEMLPMPNGAANAGVAALDGKIYVVGGHALTYYDLQLLTFDTVNVYDPVSNYWTSAAPLPTARAGVAAAALDGRLYIFGGEDGEGRVLNETLVYDPAANSWAVRAPMPGGGRAYGAAATLNGKIYVVGGWPDLAMVEVYDPATNTWTSAAALNRGRHSPGLAATPNGALVASGGGAGSQALASAEEYDPIANRWQTISSLQDGNRWGSASAYVAGRIYAVGGSGADLTEALRVAASFCLSNQQSDVVAIAPGMRPTYTVTLIPDATDLAEAAFVDTIPAKMGFAGFDQNTMGAVYNEALHQIEWRGPLPANITPLQLVYGLELGADDWQSGDVITHSIVFSASTGVAFTRTLASPVFAPDFSTSTAEFDRPQARSGEVLTYTIHLRGRTIAGGPVTVRSPLPDGLDYVADSLIYALGTGRYDETARAILWDGLIPPGRVTSGDPSYLWGDSDGRGEVAGVQFNWRDISSTGVALPGYDEYYQCDVPIGFTFPFFGKEHQSICISTNGLLSFDRSAILDFVNQCPLPNMRPRNELIAAVWDDLVVTGGLTYQLLGTAPERMFVVQWSAVRRYGTLTGDYANFQIVLHEDGQIEIAVRDAGALTGRSSTTGVENEDGSLGITYACKKQHTLHDELAVRFAPNTAGHGVSDIAFRAISAPELGINHVLTGAAFINTPAGSFTRTASIVLNSVDLTASTLQLSAGEVNLREAVTYTLAVRNTGLVAASPFFTMRVPTATVFVEGSLVCTTGHCSHEDGVVQWHGEVAANQAVTVSFALRLALPLPDRTPVASQIEFEDGYGNRYSRQVSFMARRADLSASFVQVTPPFFAPGGRARIGLYARNRGTIPATTQMDFPLPPGLTYEEGTLACTTGACSMNNGVVHWTGVVAPGSIVQVHFDVRAPVTGQYGDRFTSTLTVLDSEWLDTYYVPAMVWIAHGTYLSIIGGRRPPTLVYMPVVARMAQPVVSVFLVDTPLTPAIQQK